MSRILVAYSTNSGSTAEVAETVAVILRQGGHTADVKTTAAAADLNGYDAVVVGAPMIFGWQKTARQFVKRHQGDLAGKKVAYFACAMRLTRAAGEPLPETALTLDANLVSDPVKPGALNFKERFTTLDHYLQPMLKAAPGVKPVSVAFFNGRLEMYRLKWWQAAFVMMVVQAAPGDYRDWDAIRAWGEELGKVL
ncbi:MAG: flavodoxin domain-containing protein [Anaerolineaceae bacterium]